MKDWLLNFCGHTLVDAALVSKALWRPEPKLFPVTVTAPTGLSALSLAPSTCSLQRGIGGDLDKPVKTGDGLAASSWLLSADVLWGLGQFRPRRSSNAN